MQHINAAGRRVLVYCAGRPGGLREITAKELWRKDPTEIVRKAVYGMLPKNSLQKYRMRKLKVYAGPDHPFKTFELVPFEVPHHKTQDYKLGWVLPEGFEPMNPSAYARRMRGSRLFKPGVAVERPRVDFDDMLGPDERQLIQQQQQQQPPKPHDAALPCKQ